MEQDKITFIEEQKIKNELEKSSKDCHNQTNPIKANLVKFHKMKKLRPEDLI